MANNFIKIRGARQHNLKNIDIDIPKDKLVVFTGVSGSGKSSLAYDTIYAEGQRRYVESLSTYARQFLGLMEKPDVDLIEGLSPAISIDQKTTSRNPRSTVGTVTEIYDYMRLLFARVGHPHCPICGREISSQTPDQITEGVINQIKINLQSTKIVRFFVLSPVVRDKKGEFSSLFDNLRAKGFTQIRVDEHVRSINDDFMLIKTNKHNIDAVIDRFSVTAKDFKDQIFLKNLKSRIIEAVEQSLKLSEGLTIVTIIKDEGFEMPKYPKIFEDHLFSENFACPIDNIQIPELEPRTFSFNSPHGACKTCSGIGFIQKIDPNKVFSHELSITEGGILPFANMFESDTWYSRLILTVCDKHGINPKSPIKDLTEVERKLIMNGTGDEEYKVTGKNRQGADTYIFETFSGISNELEKRYQNTESNWVKSEIDKYMKEMICETCNGKRLSPEALGVTILEKNISDITDLSVENSLNWVVDLQNNKIFNERERNISDLILKEIKARLEFLKSVGLEYLTLSRSATTLSSGEAQRIRLASQIGSGLTGVLYVLDEPTIGLHMRDNQKLIDTLKNLKGLGNSVLVVEHDEEMMKQSDFILDFGPAAGKNGGEIISYGTPEELMGDPKSITGKYLSGKSVISSRFNKTNNDSNKHLTIKGCTEHNLKNVSLDFPLGNLIVLTGVSGSGKSTLLVETLYPALQTKINPQYSGSPGKHKELIGVENINKVILIDQSPIGKTPRSNPATYTKMFDHIRDVFASSRDAKTLGFDKGRFSFNVKGGRCEACEGQGQKKIEMQFMSDVWITCEICKGSRYNKQTLDVTFRGKNISEVLKMTVAEAKDFFHAFNPILTKLETLDNVGLSYMELGQPATTLSGGEAQRVKLSSELAKRDTGQTLYILDEPTTGLHFADIDKLLGVLKLFVEKGNTVIVIEHNIDVIKNADWIIDLGPEGGDKGGEIVVQGKLKDIINSDKSYTGIYLR